MNHRLVSLLKKYNTAGPRYTSYPTAPAWVTTVGEADYRSSLSTLKAGESLSLYFHLPFCENLCHFCGCMTVITKNHDKSRGYVDHLLIEIERVANLISNRVCQVSQIHFGGGTPNFLKPEELAEIMQSVRRHFQIAPDAEVAIEMHPRTSTKEFCTALQRLGFNRISLGVQDLDPKVQKLINRHQTYEMTEEMVVHLRSLGFQSFNFDLIYGLPGQSHEGWKETLQQVLHLRPNRLAVYSYAHIPWLKPVQRSFEDSDLPSPEMKIELFEKAYDTFTKNGYRLIGMDHFALVEDDLSRALDAGSLHRNFMGYSTKADAHQIGFGVSAISYVNGNYFQNQKELPLYDESIQKPEGLATFRGFLLGYDDAVRRDLIAKIMCRGFVDIASFDKKWQIAFQDYFSGECPLLDPFIQDGLLSLDKNKFQVQGEGFLFLRNMAMVFDRYLEGIREKAVNPVFSRTV